MYGYHVQTRGTAPHAALADVAHVLGHENIHLARFVDAVGGRGHVKVYTPAPVAAQLQSALNDKSILWWTTLNNSVLR